jgi:hypothetical protein
MENPSVSEDQQIDADEAVRLARECFDRIAAVLDEAIRKASQLGDSSMVDRLVKAKAAAKRGSSLIGNLATGVDLHRSSDQEAPE